MKLILKAFLSHSYICLVIFGKITEDLKKNRNSYPEIAGYFYCLRHISKLPFIILYKSISALSSIKTYRKPKNFLNCMK